jgi:hypothetical protein
MAHPKKFLGGPWPNKIPCGAPHAFDQSIGHLFFHFDWSTISNYQFLVNYFFSRLVDRLTASRRHSDNPHTRTVE